MTGEIQEFVKHCIETYPLAGKVLELGSRDICGSVRRWFTKDGQQKEPTMRFPLYIGVDREEGALVDQVMDTNALTFADGEFDVVISTSAIEHDFYFWRSLAEGERMLRSGGYFILTAPSWRGCPPHALPQDYYRFTDIAIRAWLMEIGMECLECLDCEQDGCIHSIGRKL